MPPYPRAAACPEAFFGRPRGSCSGLALPELPWAARVADRRACVSSFSARRVAGRLSMPGRQPASARGAAKPDTRVVLLLPQAVGVSRAWLEDSF